MRHFFKRDSPKNDHRSQQQHTHKVTIATAIGIPEGLKKTRAWRRIECLSVAAYFEALTKSIAELKWDINRIRENSTSDKELLSAFACVAADVDNQRKSIWSSRLNVLLTEYDDTNTTLLNADEGDDWC